MDKRLAVEKRIGLAIRTKRTEISWSQEELAFECGLHRTYIGAVERGEKNLTLKNLVKIAKSLNSQASELLVLAGL
jgi:transcriptional regulator with XRE-family HTH domain